MQVKYLYEKTEILDFTVEVNDISGFISVLNSANKINVNQQDYRLSEMDLRTTGEGTGVHHELLIYLV